MRAVAANRYDDGCWNDIVKFDVLAAVLRRGKIRG